MRLRDSVQIGLLAAALAVSGCGGSPSPAPAAKSSPVLPQAPAPQAKVAAESTADAVPLPPKYEAKGRRDPFETLEVREGSSGTAVTSARLTGIVHSPRGTFALIETPEGLGYIMKQGDTLGDGRLVEIGRDAVVFTIPQRPGSMTNRIVLKLPGD